MLVSDNKTKMFLICIEKVDYRFPKINNEINRPPSVRNVFIIYIFFIPFIEKKVIKTKQRLYILATDLFWRVNTYLRLEISVV